MFKNFTNKKWTACIVALIMILALISPVNVLAEDKQNIQVKDLTSNTTVSKEDSNLNSEKLQSKISSKPEVKVAKQIDIVSFNDFHGNLMEDPREKGKNVGIAKLVAAIKKAKKENPNTIVVSGGDNYQGSAMSNLTHGAPVSEMIKSVGVTASAVGNHEFDWGLQWMNKWAKDGNFTFLASNIYYKKSGTPVEWAKSYMIVEKGGIKIGFVGLTTKETAYMTKAENVKDVEFRDIAVCAKKWADYLKSGKAPEGKCDVVIALTHLGSIQDQETKKITDEVVDSKLCEVKNIDAVVSSHTHKIVCGQVNGKPVVQGYYAGRALAKLSIMLDENNKVIDIVPNVDTIYHRKSELVKDKDGEAIYNKYDKELKPILGEVLGTTDKELAHDRWNGPSLLGQWVCDVMKKAAGTEIAVTNGGGLRCPIPKGDITMGKLYEVMPFDNTLFKMELKGSDLKNVIQHGIMNEKIGWIQETGVIVTYNKDGKITSMKLEDGTPVDMNKYYTVVTNDFMFTGGDQYDFSNAKNTFNTNVPIRDELVKAVKNAKNLSIKQVHYLQQDKVKQVQQDNLKQGQKDKAKIIVYVVKPGEVLCRIARKYNMKYPQIAKYNHLKNPDLILIGQKLLIPINQ
ncbi:5'-nucleotidase C-terminal domain-containing protein [Clostridium aestuarii]|uniref:5'-nucleotidase C-terminal domain-containing protein n=1 Tax=Clostridium aestuarii TaxID=338193 RepID=A0ABT4CWC7_9CLOT|nr:5'-nucleotidase C-terminal domain-containing protein [Clostridium aestuarii]MCY6483288.1 5'-nucleotidase C-terminal domain-containing protein [Clostridium aestuarii]